jgi:penicillin-binding protein 1B
MLSDGIAIFLHALEIPAHQREALPVRITFNKDRIQSIRHLKTDQVFPLILLEPEEIMMFFGKEREDRLLISVENLPSHVTHAVLAAEDTRFFKHLGVDPLGILRAVYMNIRYGSIRQGGSTLTQQLAKNYFLTSERTFSRKFKELLISFILEYQFEKKEILEIYLNEIYFGQKGSVSINGIGKASFLYFGKSIDQLDVGEAATLAGLIKGPNLYSPYKNPELCRKRRNIVLKAMHKNGWLSNSGLQGVLVSPIHTAGFEEYGREAPFFMDYLEGQLQKLYKPEALSSLGLSIYTTLDTRVQAAAENAVQNGLKRLERLYPAVRRQDSEQQLQAAAIVMQPRTGAILAMVGGRDYSVSQFNRMTHARRQPGSTFKPFVYLSALDRFTPISRLSNMPRTIEKNGTIWRPKNFEPDAPPVVTLRSALAHSYNLATIDLALKVGLEKILIQQAPFIFPLL